MDSNDGVASSTDFRNNEHLCPFSRKKRFKAQLAKRSRSALSVSVLGYRLVNDVAAVSRT